MRRSDLPDGIYHVTGRATRGQLLYRSDLDRTDFVELVDRAVGRFGWRLHACCLMGTHYHLIVETTRAGLSGGIHLVAGTYTKRFNKRHARRGCLFEGRFDAKPIEREKHYNAALEYIRQNPVGAKLSTIADWQWTQLGALTEGLHSRQSAADYERMNFMRPFVRQDGLEVVHVTDDRVLQRDPVAAENRAGRPTDVQRPAHVPDLSQAHVLGSQSPRVLHSSEVQGDEQAAIDLECHLGQLLLGQLVGGNRLLEHDPLLRVLERRLETCAGRTHGSPDDPEPRLVEAGERTAQRARARQHVLVRHADVVED
jgi:REP element-mobilizing transposase RayT